MRGELLLVQDLDNSLVLPLVLEEFKQYGHRGLLVTGYGLPYSFQVAPCMIGEASFSIEPTPAQGTCVSSL